MVSTAKRTGRYSLRKKPMDLTSFTRVPDDAQLTWLEKGGQTGGATTQEQIEDALEEYVRLFKAGIASKAEKLTLARAFPDAPAYTSAIKDISPESVMVVGGPASIEMVDKEGHLIKAEALDRAFTKYMENFRTRNAMVLHSDVQVGWALPAYISKGGQIYKSGVRGKELFFICELRDDTRIAARVSKQIEEGKLRSYSIAGSATKVQNMQKGVIPYMQVDDMELAEVTVCEKGVNQGASFQILKAQTGKISKDQCGYRPATDVEIQNDIMCGTCKYYNKDDKTCETVDGIFEDTDYCKIFEAEEEGQPEKHDALIATPPKIKVRLILSDDGKNIDFNRTLQELVQNPEWSTSEVQTQRDFWDFTKEDEPMSITKRLLNVYKQGGDIGFDTPSKVTPSKGKGAAAMGSAVNPAMGNPEVQLADESDGQEDRPFGPDTDKFRRRGDALREEGQQLSSKILRGHTPEQLESKKNELMQRLTGKVVPPTPSSNGTEDMEKGVVDRLKGAYKGLRGQPRSLAEGGKVADDPYGRNEPDYNPATDPQVGEETRRKEKEDFWAKPENKAMGQAMVDRSDAGKSPWHGRAGGISEEGWEGIERLNAEKASKRDFSSKESIEAMNTKARAALGQNNPDREGPTQDRQTYVNPDTGARPTQSANPRLTERMRLSPEFAEKKRKQHGGLLSDWEQGTEDLPTPDVDKSLVKRLLAVYKADSDPMTTGEAFTTLENTEARVKEHEQLLREYGFPSEIGAEAGRYIPVVEIETDDKGVPIHMKGPWVVNEAGQDAGELLDEDAPSFSASEKAHNREGKKTASISKSYFLNPPTVPFLSKRSM
mgnify:CR=1 FL=1